MKKIIACVILVLFCGMVLPISSVEAKMNTKKSMTVSSYRKGKNGIHYHSTYKTTRTTNASKKRRK